MDKKLTFTGGEPNINWDDLNRDEEANRDAMFAIMDAFKIGTNENFIISGCVATLTTGVNVVITAGYIFLNGEILEVEAQTVVDGGTLDLYKYTKVVTYDTNGNKTFNDGTSRQTWQKNRGVVVAATAPILTTELDVVDGKRLNLGVDDWQTPALINGWASHSASPFKFRLNGDRLEFKGALDKVASSADGPFALPSGFRPIKINMAIAAAQGTGTPVGEPVLVNNQTGGSYLLIIERAAMTGNVVYFDGISFSMV